MILREFEVRKDLDLYIKGDISAFKESFPGVSLPSEMITEISEEIKLIAGKSETVGITAVHESTPIGFVVGSLQLFYVVPFLYIESIYVEPEYRGNGFGGALLEKAEKWGESQGAKFVQLHVSVGKESAIGSYRKSGYSNTRLQMDKML